MRLSLDDAIHTTLERNIGVQLQRYDLGMAGAQLYGSYFVFDPLATATLDHTNSQNPVSSAFQSSGGTTTDANVALRDTIPTGGNVSIGASNRRFTSTGNGTIFSPGFNTGLTFGLTQPLARNFGVDITRRGITIARNTLGINQEAFKVVMLDTTSAVEQAYYDLIYTRRFVDVVKEALFLARDQARITQIRIDVGASAPLDILQPRVQIATTEESLINAVAAVRSAEDRLRALLNVPADEWDRPLVEALAGVGDEQVRVEGVEHPQPVALGAHPLRAVEAEQLRAGRLVTAVAVQAGVVGRQEDVFAARLAPLSPEERGEKKCSPRPPPRR